ncbi:MAG TPA: bifunctional glutamate N-acetyltransferase/amino-acid acetyltransferase ArgJ [Anaerolineae bacterium]|nr:bifunctional glutamate N-acetyltransferase/amino-acid acetyltransferase ArgJ [Anaerolineae bacterium]
MTEIGVPGFRFAGVACGLKPQTAAYGGRALDLALIVSDAPCSAAGVFTQNRFPAAPVLYDRQALQANPTAMRTVVINAGNANACTGEQGLADAQRMAALAEAAFDLPAGSALVMSTGVIGLPLPMDKIEQGISAAATLARSETGQSGEGQALAAQAIMTTDTKPKLAARSVDGVDLLGMAKGAAMIHPNMATMLAVIVSDAAVAPDALHATLRRAVEHSFNAISVDGDTSTNDTVLVLANGLAGPVDPAAFERALADVCTDLAQQIVRDAEGASKFITVQVSGAASEADARQVAQTIATSLLVKTAVYGGDPNWGRVLAAAGRSGVELDPACAALWFAGDGGDEYPVVADGAPLAYDEAEAARIFACHDLLIHLDLGAGAAEATVWTSDLTHDYVSLNAHYRT